MSAAVDVLIPIYGPELPPDHSGEDVLVQLHLMARYGGYSFIPSGVYHQELATTVVDRRYDAPRVLNLGLEGE